jgi:hypothetical protein
MPYRLASQVGDPFHPHFIDEEVAENEQRTAPRLPPPEAAGDWGTGAGEVNRPERTRPMDPHEVARRPLPPWRSVV